MYRRAGMVVAIAGLLAGAWVRMGPLPDGLLDLDAAQSVQVVDRFGELLYEARSDQGSRTTHLSADSLPQTLAAATVAAEDRRFEWHPGIDPVATARAAGRNLWHRHVVEGGSTITQQVAKLLLLRRGGGSRGLVTKAREALLAIRLEHRLSKAEILALYLNLAAYGNQLVGAESASRAYFGCPAALLTPAQAAFLAALPQRPTAFNPYRDPGKARARQLRVLDRMAATGSIGAAALEEARAERLSFIREPAAFVAPHFVQHVLASGVGAQDARPGVEHPAHRISTTLDAALQREVRDIIRGERAALDAAGAHNVAAVILDNATGEWLAWEGSGDYDDALHGGTIDGVVAPRQPGSALKPFTYALAFEQGETPATVLPDVPSFFATADTGILYGPKNYDGQYRGPMLARQALAGSENVPAVALASRVGVPALVRFLRRAGLTTLDRTAAHYGLGITLGDAEVRLDELVAAYAAFARGGRVVRPTFLRPPAWAANDARPAADEGELLTTSRTAFWITDILADPAARAYAFGRGGSLEFSFPVAAKTGTSQAYRDNWAIGYTRHVTVGVWVGNFDRTPLVNSSGVTGAGPIFHSVLTAAERRATGELPSATDPPTEGSAAGLVRRTVCTLSGQAATRWCPSQIEEWLPADGPADSCAWHQPVGGRVVVAWPAEYRQWAESAGALRQDVQIRETPAAFRITNPPRGAIYLIDPTLRPGYQTLPLRTAGAEGRVEWRVDGRAVGVVAADAPLRWPLAHGRHTIDASDRAGRAADTVVVVK